MFIHIISKGLKMSRDDDLFYRLVSIIVKLANTFVINVGWYTGNSFFSTVGYVSTASNYAGNIAFKTRTQYCIHITVWLLNNRQWSSTATVGLCKTVLAIFITICCFAPVLKLKKIDESTNRLSDFLYYIGQ